MNALGWVLAVYLWVFLANNAAELADLILAILRKAAA